MVRVVRATAGVVEIDPTGKKAGRGAYVCRSWECWHIALRRKALEHALKTDLSTADRQALAAFAEQQPANPDQLSAGGRVAEARSADG